MDGLTVALIVSAVVVGLAVGTAIGAMILRASVSLCNKMAGGADSASAVPEPSFGKAMGTIFLTNVANAAVVFLVGIVVGVTGTANNLKGADVIAIAELMSLPGGFIVMAVVVSILLPTTFARGILVTLCHFLIAAAIVVGGAIAAFALSLVLG